MVGASQRRPPPLRFLADLKVETRSEPLTIEELRAVWVKSFRGPGC